MPFGAPVDYYKIGDMETAITRFPEMNFQMVHAGFAFVEETAIYLRSYKNFYANLEATISFADKRTSAGSSGRRASACKRGR